MVAEGQHFRCADGTRWTGKDTTDFQLYQRFLNGEDLRPVLDQRREVGVNMVRVLGMCDYMFKFDPRQFPEFFSRLPEFFALLGRYGIYPNFVVFADAALVMPNRDEQIAHWDRFRDPAIVAAMTGLLSVGNELDQAYNRLAADGSLTKIDGVLCSRGSNGSEKMPPGFVWYPDASQPDGGTWKPDHVWDWCELHTNGADEEQRKCGHNTMEMWRGPSACTEMSRFPDVGMWRGADPARVRQLAFDIGRSSALLTGSVCGHTTSGKFSRLWDDGEAMMMTALVAGCQSMDLAYQDGDYVHGAAEKAREAQLPALRCYRRVNGPSGDSPFADIRR